MTSGATDAMRYLLTPVAMVLFFSTGSFLTENPKWQSQVRIQEMGAFQTSDFASRFKNSAVGSFALSPDGAILAVEFEADEGNGMLSTWVALCDAQKRLTASQRLEGPYAFADRNPAYRHAVGFTPSGRELLVLTGPRLLALSLPDLKTVYAIESLVPRERSETGRFLRGFSIAAKAERLAVLYWWMGRPSTELEIDDLKSWRTVARLTLPMAGSVALSPDGSLLALVANPVTIGMKVPPQDHNIFVFSTPTGKLVRAFNTSYAAADAQFLPDGEELATIPAEHETPKLYTLDEIKVWKISTGRMERELRYKKYGVRGAMALSSDGKLLAAVTYWHNPWDIQLDRDVIRGFARVLIWNLDSDDDRPMFASSDLQGYGREANNSYLAVYWVCFSARGTRLAVGGQRISVYSVERATAQRANGR